MDVRPVDPRDIRWEDDGPIFRVTFWRSQAAGGGHEAREVEVSGVDVVQALDWADHNARSDETFTLYVVVKGSDLGQIHLAGTDPTSGKTS